MTQFLIDSVINMPFNLGTEQVTENVGCQVKCVVLQSGEVFVSYVWVSSYGLLLRHEQLTATQRRDFASTVFDAGLLPCNYEC
jgi:hypothetical protein